MTVRLVQLDGDLPNLALMRLAHWHRAQGHTAVFTRSVYRQLFEPERYDRVYASAIFNFSAPTVELLKNEWPEAIVGGTYQLKPREDYQGPRVEQFTGTYEKYDYSDYPAFKASIGFTQRGCRLRCAHCVVPWMEGKPRTASSINDIWRGEPWPKQLHLLDNDFFGVPEWRDRIREIREGGFKVCLSQGINVRMITEESAAALASIEYRNTKFTERKLYTAWDLLGDEKIFFRGVDLLEAAGVPPSRLYAYMLIGHDKKETWATVWYRFKRMTDRGIEPFAMTYDRTRQDLICFARWVNRGLYRIDGCSWPEYERATKTQESVDAWYEIYGNRAL